MSDYVSKEVENIYSTLTNSDSLRTVLESNYLLLKRENYIGQYTETLFNKKVSEIEEINKENLYSLAAILYSNKDTINSLTISLLIDNSF